MFEELSAGVDALLGRYDVAGWDGAACLAGLAAAQRAINVLEGWKLRLVAEFAQQRSSTTRSRWCRVG